LEEKKTVKYKITAEKLVNGGKDVGINLKLSKASKMIAEIDENGEWTFSYIHE
jgi:hypothetical protein